jgi:hypothetical protein
MTDKAREMSAGRMERRIFLRMGKLASLIRAIVFDMRGFDTTFIYTFRPTSVRITIRGMSSGEV